MDLEDKILSIMEEKLRGTQIALGCVIRQLIKHNEAGEEITSELRKISVDLKSFGDDDAAEALDLILHSASRK